MNQILLQTLVSYDSQISSIKTANRNKHMNITVIIIAYIKTCTNATVISKKIFIIKLLIESMFNQF